MYLFMHININKTEFAYVFVFHYLFLCIYKHYEINVKLGFEVLTNGSIRLFENDQLFECIRIIRFFIRLSRI